jgi:hypothetical protein
MVRDIDIRDKFRTAHPGIIGFLDYIYAECSDDEFESVVKDCGIKVRHISSFGISDYKCYDFKESYIRVENYYSECSRLHVSIEDVNGHIINLYTPFLMNRYVNPLRIVCLYLCAHSNAVRCGRNLYDLKTECEKIFNLYANSTYTSPAYPGFLRTIITERYIRRLAFDVEKSIHLEVLTEFIKCSYEYINTILDICNENNMNELTMTILRIIEEEGLRENAEPIRL